MIRGRSDFGPTQIGPALLGTLEARETSRATILLWDFFLQVLDDHALEPAGLGLPPGGLAGRALLVGEENAVG